MGKAQEYSANVWLRGECALSLYVASGEAHGVNSLADAVEWAHKQATERGVITPQQACEIDVSEGASEEWFTFRLKGESKWPVI